MVRYADDFVILCRDTGPQASATMRQLMEVLKLTVNEAKPQESRGGGGGYGGQRREQRW